VNLADHLGLREPDRRAERHAADLDRIALAAERELSLAAAAADDEAGLVEVELDLAVGREGGRRERQHERRHAGRGNGRRPASERL